MQDDAGTALGGQDTFSRSFVVTVSDSPSLRLVRTQNVVVLSWSTNSVGFHLETQPGLSDPSAWMQIPNEPFVIGDQNVVTNSLGDPYRFYRLRK